jgi:hypothetical protein
MKQRPPTATITGPHGIFRYHASYTDGIFCVEGGSIALTRKGIERKARRVLRKLQRERELHDQAIKVVGIEPCPVPLTYPSGGEES